MNKQRFDTILKIALPVSFLWFFIETVEAAALFYNFFPRGGFFKITFDSVVLKFIAWPAVKILAGTFLLYFLTVFFCAGLSVFITEKIWPKNKWTAGKGLFHAFNVYTFLYLIMSYNAFLMPLSAGRHMFLYEYIFPQRVILSDYTAVDFFSVFHYAVFGYWLVLIFGAIVSGGGLLLKSWRQPGSFTWKKGYLCAGLAVGAAVLLIFFGQACLRRDKTFTRDQNIIFIGLDSFQYNQLSPEWGSASVPAPDILRFLKEGTYFTNVWTAFARTYPSYMSILTGRYPVHHGIRANLVQDHHASWDNVYLGDILKQQGYHRFYATDDVRFSNIRAHHGFDKTFTPQKNVAGFLITSFYDYSLGNILLYYDSLPGLFDVIRDNRAATGYHPRVFVRHVIEQIRRLPRDRRQFIVIHLCVNHHPYTAVYPYARNPELTSASERCMRAANDQFVMLMDYLKASGLYDRSLIFVLSDHGSGWDAKKQRLSHGSDFEFIEAYRSILGIHGKGWPAGKEIRNRIRTVDIYPSVMEWIGVPVPESIDGQSVIPLVRGEEEGRPRSVFAETGYPLDFRYSTNLFDQGQQIQNEVSHYAVDSHTGYVYIDDNVYKSLVDRKWYMLIDGNYRFVYRPWKQDRLLYDMDGQLTDNPAVVDHMQSETDRLLRDRH